MHDIYLHHLAFVAAGRVDELTRVGDKGMQVSHRCHNARCFNIEHLVVESGEANLVRLFIANANSILS